MFGLDLKRTVFLFDGIHQWTAERVLADLMEKDKEAGDLNVIINSQGGVVSDGFAIIDGMKILKNKVNTIVLGQSSSAGATISISGATGKRYMSENSKIMIHGVSFGSYGLTQGVEESLERAKEVQRQAFEMIAKSSKLSIEEIEKQTEKKDWFINSKEALELGLIDAVLTKEEFETLKLSETVKSEIKLDTELKEVHLIQSGVFHCEKYGKVEITENHLKGMLENFNKNVVGRDVSLDYTHENDNGEKKAGAWIKSLEIKNNGLYATVEYTPSAKQMIKDKEYQYVSSEFSINYKNHEGNIFDVVLLGGAFTNRPVVKNLNKLKLSEGENMKLSEFKKDEIVNCLKETHKIDIVQLSADKELAENKLKETEKEVEMLKAEKKAQEEKAIQSSKQDCFNKLVEEGKVLKKQEEKVMKLFANQESMMDFYKDTPAIVNVNAKGDGSASEKELDDRAKRIADATNLDVASVKETIKNKKG